MFMELFGTRFELEWAVFWPIEAVLYRSVGLRPVSKRLAKSPGKWNEEMETVVEQTA